MTIGEAVITMNDCQTVPVDYVRMYEHQNNVTEQDIRYCTNKNPGNVLLSTFKPAAVYIL